MNKFALAALGVVAAHPHPSHVQNLGHDYGFQHELLGQFIDFSTDAEKADCNLKEGDRLPDTIFYRELTQGVFNSAIKGMYHENT